MASRTKQSVFCLILFVVTTLEISLANPIYDAYEPTDHEYSDLLDSAHDEEGYHYETEEIVDNSTYQCPDQMLSVRKDSLCDGFPDCSDASDEDRAVCEEYEVEVIVTTTLPPVAATATPSAQTLRHHPCNANEFQCPSETGLCVPLKAICDGTGDCPEGEDELFCNGAGTNNAGASSGPIDNTYRRRIANHNLPSRSSAEWRFDGGSVGGSSAPNRRNGLLFRFNNHKRSKMRTMHHQKAPSSRSQRRLNLRITSPRRRPSYYDNPLASSNAIRRLDSDLTPPYQHAELNTVSRQLPLSRERNGAQNGYNGQTGETNAANFLSRIDQLSDEDAETLLRAYATLSSAKQRVNPNTSRDFLQNPYRNGQNLHFSSLSKHAESSPTNLQRTGKQSVSVGHKKKLKNSINQLIRRFGKLLSSTSLVNQNDIDINISIQSPQRTNNNYLTASETNEQSEPVIKIKLEMTL